MQITSNPGALEMLTLAMLAAGCGGGDGGNAEGGDATAVGLPGAPGQAGENGADRQVGTGGGPSSDPGGVGAEGSSGSEEDGQDATGNEDGDGGNGNETPIGPTSPPDITGYQIDGAQPMIGDPVTFARSYAGGGAGTVCRLDVDGDDGDSVVLDPCGPDASYTHAYDRPGEYEVTLTVENAAGDAVAASRTVTVAPISFEAIADGPATPGGRLRYTVVVSNVADVPVDDVSLLPRVPEGASFAYAGGASPDADFGRCSYVCTAGEEAFWTFASLPAGASRSIEVNASVLEDVRAGSLTGLAPSVSLPPGSTFVSATGEGEHDATRDAVE